MTKHRDFHESYYEHNCVVIDTDDVLKSDIPGNSFKTKLRRWWFNWFFVSYSDERARLYFGSSHAMRMERLRHYRNYRNRIHPLSKFRYFRDVFIFILFLVNTVVFHHNTSITFGQFYGGFYYFGALMELIIIADVFISLQTGYIDIESGKIILEKRFGLLHYCSTKLFVHVASALPLQCIMLMRYGSNVNCSLCKTNNFIITLKVLSFFGLLRLYEHSSFLTRERNNFVITHALKFLRIYLVGMMIMLYYIDLSEAVTLNYMIDSGRLIDGVYVTLLIKLKYVYPNPPSNFVFLIHNFGRITKSILLFSLSFWKTQYYLDVIMSMVAFIIANIIHLWQIIECYDFLCRLCFLDDSVIRLKQSSNHFVCCRQLPDNITKKINSYYDYNQSKMRAMELSNNFLNSLPKILKIETLLARHTRLLKRVSYFSEWPFHVLEDVVLMLKEEIYLTNDLVAEPWVPSEGLFIVGMGELAVYNEDIEIDHLIDGDYFGELSLVTDKELRTSRIVAITPCVMLLLEKNTLRTYMRQQPELFTALKKEIYNSLNVGSNNKSNI